MKWKTINCILSFLLVSSTLNAQSIPDVTVENIKGVKVSARTLCDSKKPVVISFWATWCKPCIKEIDTIAELLDEWREEIDFIFAAVSIDDSRSVSKARSFASGRGWERIDFFFDVNSNFYRALNISSVPFLVVYDRNGKAVYRHSGYVPGDENELIEVLRKL